MQNGEVPKRPFLRKGGGHLAKNFQVNYPPVPTRPFVPPQDADGPPDSGRGTADDGRPSPQSTVTRLKRTEKHLLQLKDHGGEYGQWQTPSSGRSVHLTTSSLSDNQSSRPTLSSPPESDFEAPRGIEPSANGGHRQINATAAQLRDMIANFDFAELLKSKKLEEYHAHLQAELNKETKKVEDELREQYAELRRQQQLFANQKKNMASENQSQAQFLQRDYEELREASNAKSRKISELTTIVRELKNEIEKLLSDKERSEKRCGELSKNVSELSSELARMRNQQTTDRNEVVRLKTQLSAANKTIGDLQCRLKKKETVGVQNVQPKPKIKNFTEKREPARYEQSSTSPNDVESISSSCVGDHPTNLKNLRLQNLDHTKSGGDLFEHEATTSSIGLSPTGTVIPRPGNPLAPQMLHDEILSCGCLTLCDHNGIVREWTHCDDAFSVKWSEDGSHIQLNSPQSVRVTFAQNRMIYIVEPPSDSSGECPGMVIDKWNSVQYGTFTTKGEKGLFREREMTGDEYVKYQEDNSLGCSIGDLLIRRFADNDTKIVITGVHMNFNHRPGNLFRMSHVNAESGTKTDCLYIKF